MKQPELKFKELIERTGWANSHNPLGRDPGKAGEACYCLHHMKNTLFKRFYLFIFRERGREEERERKVVWLVVCCLSYVSPYYLTKPAAQVCALTGNGSCDLSFFRTMPNPLSLTCQGEKRNFYNMLITRRMPEQVALSQKNDLEWPPVFPQ